MATPYLIEVTGEFHPPDGSALDLTIYLLMVKPWVEANGMIVPGEVVVLAPAGVIPSTTYYIVMEPSDGATFSARIVRDDTGEVVYTVTMDFGDPGAGSAIDLRNVADTSYAETLLGEFYYFDGSAFTGTLRVTLRADWLRTTFGDRHLITTLPATVDYTIAQPSAQGIEDVTNADPAVVTLTSHGYSNGDLVDVAGARGMTQLNGRRLMVANQTANDFELRAEPVTMTGATKANPCVITAPGHTFLAGDTVYIDRVLGMVELNGNEYTVANPVGNTFELSGINSSAYTTYASGGEVRGMVDSSAYGAYPSFAITGATKANPCVVTAPGHTFVAKDSVSISGVVGMTELNGNTYDVDNISGDTFELVGIDSSTYGAYVSDGAVRLVTDGTVRWANMIVRGKTLALPLTYDLQLLDNNGVVIWSQNGVALTEDFPGANRCTISDQITALNQS